LSIEIRAAQTIQIQTPWIASHEVKRSGVLFVPVVFGPIISRFRQPGTAFDHPFTHLPGARRDDLALAPFRVIEHTVSFGCDIR
jgi:hypothetical protein